MVFSKGKLFPNPIDQKRKQCNDLTQSLNWTLSKPAKIPIWQFVISNTTESGIEFNADDISVEVLPSNSSGKITKLLYHRFTYYKGADDKGLYFLPCELIEKNG